MIKSTNYYKILGVDTSASVGQIKAAYHKLALKYHPDRNPHNPKMAEEQFRKITQAYEVLKDKEKRYAYDTLGRYDESMRPRKEKEDPFISFVLLVAPITFLVLYELVFLIRAIWGGIVFALLFHTIAFFLIATLYGKEELSRIAKFIIKTISFFVMLIVSYFIFMHPDAPENSQIKTRSSHYYPSTHLSNTSSVRLAPSNIRLPSPRISISK